ncbi:MAG: UDP-N-acetylmuramate--L-alanine ligase [Bacteroidales bacterium]|nr:UDP-N-acetylmuramate--L-alanine ligase [Bacteroidales bacterium]
MSENPFKSVYFLGIGGIGMSALARYFLQQGAHVAGYDKTASALTDQLISEGMEIHFNEDPSRIPVDVDLAIWTPAVPREHAEYRHLLKRGIRVKKRAEVLGEIANPFSTIAVAGTHGKTTTSTMIAHIFHSAGKPMMALLGGISKNYGTNYVQLAEGSGQFCIVEADEFDRSFLQLSPDIAIITSMDADHLDIYNHRDQLKESFGDFTGKIRNNGKLIIKKGVEIDREVPEEVSRFTYSLQGDADFYASNIAIREGLIHFDFITPEAPLPGFVLGMPGMFNLENAIAALAASWLSGIPEAEMKRALLDFGGVVRRFDIRIKRNDFVYIDDYAHHPEELHACIQAVRELYPGKQITGIFQPHLYSRTRDLADDFARALAELDSLILLEIYPAREQPIEGIHSRMLLDKTNLSDKLLCDRKELPDILEKRHPEVLLTLGAGDIDQLVMPIVRLFETKEKHGKTSVNHSEQEAER